VAFLIPPEPAHRSSRAEVTMFRRFAALSDQWTVLHSVGLARHPYKAWSEIDFTLVGPPGVFLVEVKGGDVTRTRGEWWAATADGRLVSLGRGPFDQVGGAEAATRQFIQERLTFARDTTFGYMVATPDCRLEVDDLGIDPHCVYDARNANEPIGSVVQRLAVYWRRRTDRGRDMSASDARGVVGLLCGDISSAPDLRHVVADVEREMEVRTAEQERAVRDLGDTRAAWFVGSAGSGRTILAVEEVKRAVLAGAHVAYVCSSVALASWVQDLLGEQQSVDILNVDRLLGLEHVTERSSPWDVVVVDEANEVMEERCFAILDKRLIGGVKDGQWRVFVDPNDPLYPHQDARVVDLWQRARPARMHLSRNCRTTLPIAHVASALADVPLQRGLEQAPRPTMTFLDSSDDLVVRVRDQFNRFITNGLQRDEIMVLTPLVLDRETQERLEYELNASGPNRPDRSPVHPMTISSLEGQQACAVILADIHNLDEPWMRRQAYLGCSRATTYLHVVLPASLEKTIVDRFAKVALRSRSDGPGTS
jgi:hypothetical protein